MHQYAVSRKLSEKLSTTESIIHHDISESYTCKYGAEIQAVHFGACHQQAMLHTGALYIGYIEEPVTLCNIYLSRRHDMIPQQSATTTN